MSNDDTSSQPASGGGCLQEGDTESRVHNVFLRMQKAINPPNQLLEVLVDDSKSLLAGRPAGSDLLKAETTRLQNFLDVLAKANAETGCSCNSQECLLLLAKVSCLDAIIRLRGENAAHVLVGVRHSQRLHGAVLTKCSFSCFSRLSCLCRVRCCSPRICRDPQMMCACWCCASSG